MANINWIILSSAGRGVDYGVGTFIKQLSQGLARRKNISVFILEIGFSKHKSFNIRNEEDVTFFEIPLSERTNDIDTRRNQEKIGRSIARVVGQYIPTSGIMVVHMSFIFQYFIAKELKQTLKSIVLFTQHVFIAEEKIDTNHFNSEFETYQMVDQIITVTRHGKEHIINKGIRNDKVEIIYNGIASKQFKNGHQRKIKEKYGLNKDEKMILYSGRIDTIKGLEYLSVAFASLLKKIPDSRLVIAGNGNFESLIKSTKHFSANISFLGFIPFEDVLSLYHISDIGVIPSLEEHCSYVALEMLHSGLPAVVSKVGGLKEIFIHNENALLVDVEPNLTNNYGIAPEIEQLANSMYKLLTDEHLRKKFSSNAVKRANEEFTAEKMARRYVEIILNQD